MLKNIEKGICILAFFLVLLIPSASAYEINQFNDTTTSKNFTADGLAYVNMSKTAVIINSTMNLTGYTNPNYTFVNSTPYYTLCTGSFHSSYPCLNGFDNDWDSYSDTNDGFVGFSTIENYTFTSNNINISWKGYVKDSSGYTPSIEFQCRNWTSGSWVVLGSISETESSGGPVVESYIVPSSCINDSFNYTQRVTGGSGAPACTFLNDCHFKYYDTNFSVSEIIYDISLDTADNGFSDYNSTNLSTTINIDLNKTAIQDFLGSCTAISGNCSLPLNLTADFNNGTIEMSNLNITYSLTQNTVMLTANPSWNIDEGDSVTISCSATEGTPSLYKSGGLVANPYTATLSSGTYTFNCTVGDTGNYSASYSQNTLVVNPVSSDCLSISVYAFEKNISVSGTNTTFNFTDVINQSLVKTNLTDVYIIEGRTAWVYSDSYLVVNTTDLSSVTLRFGNYLGNNTYATAAGTSGTVENITAYTEINSYYRILVFDEMTNTLNLPFNSTITGIARCSLGTSYFSINDTSMLLATNDTMLDALTATVMQGSDNYFRNLVFTTPYEYRQLFLVDLNNNTMVKITFSLTDVIGSFLDSLFSVRKELGGGVYVMTQDYWDAESKMIAYLVVNEKYQLHAYNGAETRIIGDILADATGTKEISLVAIQLYNESNMYNEVFWSLTNGSNYIRLTYNDTLNQTINVSLSVYHDNGTLAFFSYDDTGSPNLQITYTGVQLINHTYIAQMNVTHSYYGTITQSKQFGVYSEKKEPGIPNAWYAMGAFGFLMCLMLMFGAVHAKYGVLFVSLTAIGFYAFGWISAYIPFEVLALCIFVSILALLGGREK